MEEPFFPLIIALDARVVLHSTDIREEELPQPAIRPYPIQYVKSWIMKDGQPVTIRPIRPEDEPLAVKFHETLSEESVYLRYFHLIKLQTRVAHGSPLLAMLHRLQLRDGSGCRLQRPANW